MTGHISDSDSLTDIYGKVQALSIKKPEEDDVTILVSMRNCTNSTTKSASQWSAHRVLPFLDAELKSCKAGGTHHFRPWPQYTQLS